MTTREDMTVQERIDAALELAGRICAQCRPDPELGYLTPAEYEANWREANPAPIESGPQSEAQFEEQMRELYPGWGEAE